MRVPTSAFAVLIVLATAIQPVQAQSCATPVEQSALRTAAVQQQLMVAALTCHADAAYNDFVQAYRSELVHADGELKKYFARRVGGRGEAASDTFKTRLANLSSFSTIKNRATYCANADAAFAAAMRERQTLDSFVADQRLLIALPEAAMCETKVLEAKAEKLTHRSADLSKPDMPKSDPPKFESKVEIAKVEMPRAKPAETRLDAARAKPPVRLASVAPAEAAPVHVRTAAMVDIPAHDLPASPFSSAPSAPPRAVRLAMAEEPVAGATLRGTVRRATAMRDDYYENTPPPPRPSQRLIEAAREQYGYGRYAAWGQNRPWDVNR